MKEIENFKQLSEDLSTGKNLILDYNNNEIECTKYGIKKPKYSRNITGQNNYQTRLNKGLINKVEYGPVQYFPFSSRLLGSSMYPRPLSIPFIKNENKDEKLILEEIKKNSFYNLSNNKKLFALERNKSDLPSYFCVKLGLESQKDKKHLIGLFSSEIENTKKKYRYEPKYYKKDSIFKALTQNKNIFENNLSKDMINGEKIPFATQKDIGNKFKLIKKLIVKNSINANNAEEKEINREEYEKLYKIKKIKEMTHQNFFNRNNMNSKKTNLSMYNKSKNENISNKENIIQNMKSLSGPRKVYYNPKGKSRQKDLNASSTDDKQISFQNTLNKSIKFNSTITTCYNYNSDNNFTNNESKISKNIPTSKNEIYSPKSIITLKRTISDFNKNMLNKLKDDSKINLEDNYDIDSNNIKDNKNKKIRNLKEIKENCLHETELMKGFKNDINIELLNKEPKKLIPPNYISPLTIYKREIEMFIKVNPIEHQNEIKRKLFDDKILRKKLQNKQYFERIKIKK